MHNIWRRFPKTAKIQLKEHYFKKPLPKKPSKIFVGSSTDMWGHWIPDEWIRRVLDLSKANPQHTFQFLTKNPRRYSYFNLKGLDNCYFGATIDGAAKTYRNIVDLIYSLPPGTKKFISFEPLIKRVNFEPFCMHFIDWIIIGADSRRGAKKPPQEWASFLIDAARKNDTAVFVKDNYGYPKIIKEFPKWKHQYSTK